MTIYDLIDNKEINSILEIGNGPNEFSDIISYSHSSDKIAIYEKNIFRYSIVDILNDSVINIKRYPKLNTDISTLVGNDQFYITSGYFKQRFNLYDIKKKSTFQFGEYPEIIEPLTQNAKGMFFQGFGVLNSNKNLYVFATNSIPIVDFYKLDGLEPELIKRVEYDSELDFKDLSSDNSIKIQYNNDHQFGFRSITSSDKHILILYSGKTQATDGNLYSSGNEIHVFNFEGDLLKKLKFDIPLNVIRVDAELGVMYGLSPNSDDAIYYVSLKDCGL